MEVRTEIVIAKPAADVWKVLLDFRRYADWNPFIVAIAGEATVGSKLDVTLSLPDSNRERQQQPRVVKCESERELRWLGHLWMKGLFDGEHFFRLEALDAGHTRFVHGEDFDGLLLKLMLSDVTLTTRGFVYMNQALKLRAEEGTRAARARR